MPRAGKALRDGWAYDKAASKLCRCGHAMGEHRELRPTWTVRDGRPVEIPHPDYKPLHFHCGCGCVHIGRA